VIPARLLALQLTTFIRRVQIARSANTTFITANIKNALNVCPVKWPLYRVKLRVINVWRGILKTVSRSSWTENAWNALAVSRTTVKIQCLVECVKTANLNKQSEAVIAKTVQLENTWVELRAMRLRAPIVNVESRPSAAALRVPIVAWANMPKMLETSPA